MHSTFTQNDCTRSVRDSEFELIKRLIYQKAGIFLKDHKKTLVANRLRKRLDTLGLDNYRDYYDYITQNPTGRHELSVFIDCLTTNETFFFRYREQLDYLTQTILPERIVRKRRDEKIRVWSAGCSSGEEPYSIAILMNERFERNALDSMEIVASDISQSAIEKAQLGAYRPYAVQRIQEPLKKKYFVKDTKSEDFQLNGEIQKRIRFFRHNLLEPFRQGKFDVVLCCNVLIYFDKESKNKAIANIFQSLKSDGCFLVGFSESLMENMSQFAYIRPAVYRKMES
ncbi:MAG TPA: protein-glutamate O-methyltransferase CheR [bacterium]